jgi:hypothetical protein
VGKGLPRPIEPASERRRRGREAVQKRVTRSIEPRAREGVADGRSSSGMGARFIGYGSPAPRPGGTPQALSPERAPCRSNRARRGPSEPRSVQGTCRPGMVCAAVCKPRASTDRAWRATTACGQLPTYAATASDIASPGARTGRGALRDCAGRPGRGWTGHTSSRSNEEGLELRLCAVHIPSERAAQRTGYRAGQM